MLAKRHQVAGVVWPKARGGTRLIAGNHHHQRVRRRADRNRLAACRRLHRKVKLLSVMTRRAVRGA